MKKVVSALTNLKKNDISIGKKRGNEDVNILRTSFEAEMISEFLRTEYHSERFSEQIKKAIRKLSLDESIFLSLCFLNAYTITSLSNLSF